MEKPVIADRILDDLEKLWRELGAGKPEGVVRAAAMTLIVFAEGGEDSADAASQVTAITREHPNRAIVVRLEPPGTHLDGSVVAECWRPFGGQEQICSERIEIRVSDAAGLAPVLLALAAPDLPVVFWARSPAALDLAEATALALRPTRMIVNAEVLAKPDFERLRRCTVRVADLAWTAGVPERRQIRDIFDSPEARSALSSVDSVVVSYAGELPPASAWYSAAWVLNILRRDVDVRFRGGSAAGIELRAGSRMIASARRPGAPAKEAVLLSQELSVDQRDTQYEAALATAARLKEEH